MQIYPRLYRTRLFAGNGGCLQSMSEEWGEEEGPLLRYRREKYALESMTIFEHFVELAQVKSEGIVGPLGGKSSVG